MKPTLLTHKKPLSPNLENLFFASISSAIRWLELQPPFEMLGDDSVGWWLLMEMGKFPSSEVIEKLSTKIASLLAGKPLVNGVLYTFTAIGRTLNRAGYPLNSSIYDTLKNTMSRKFNNSNIDINHIWLLQMAAELAPDLAKDYLSNNLKLEQFDESKLLLGSSILILMNILDIQIPSSFSDNIAKGISAILDGRQIEEVNDWNIAYYLWAMLCLDDITKARQLGEKLLIRQSNGAWDENSEECIESTSICGLALLDLSIMILEKDKVYEARSRSIHEVLMLLDKFNWLLHRWQKIQLMPKNQEKGWALESFIVEWVSFETSMSVYKRNLRGGTDEIDVVVELNDSCPIYKLIEPSRFILFECKQKSQTIGPRDVRAFRDSLRQRRSENCKLGVFISSAGFTRGAENVFREDLGKDQIIISLSGSEIKKVLQQRLVLSKLLYDKIKENILRKP